MLFLSGVVLVLTSIWIFFQKHIVKIIKSIFIILKENLLRDKVQYSKAVGRLLLALGVSFMLIARVPWENISIEENTINDAVIIVTMLIITIVLVILHNFIANLIFKKEKTAPKNEDFSSDMLLPQKIQYYMGSKRYKSKIFHIGYFIMLGTLYVIITGYLYSILTKKTIFDIQFTVPIIALLTVLLAVKQLLLTDNNKADSWLPILYEIEKRTGESLLEEELNKTLEFEKSMERKAVYNSIIGLLVGVILLVIVVLYLS